MRRAGLLIAAAVVGVAGLLPVAGTAQTPKLASGVATASGVYARYADQETFFPGATTPPPDGNSIFASAGVDRTGIAVATAAMSYSGYMELLGAINGVAPPGFPALPADTIADSVRARVEGVPPKEQDASVAAQEGIEGGRATARLEEGPIASAVAVGTGVAGLPDVSFDQGRGRADVADSGTAATSESLVELRDVAIGGALHIDSVVLTGSASADGAHGQADGSVVVDRATVGETPVLIDETGIHAAGQDAPLGADPVSGALAAAGITFLGAGTVTEEPGPERSVVEAQGPAFRVTSPDGHTVDYVLGKLQAVSTYVAAETGPQPAPPPVLTEPGPSPTAGPAVVTPTVPPPARGTARTPTTSGVAAPPATPEVAPDASAPRSPTGQALAWDIEPLILSRAAADDEPARVDTLYLILLMAAVPLVLVGVVRPWRGWRSGAG